MNHNSSAQESCPWRARRRRVGWMSFVLAWTIALTTALTTALWSPRASAHEFRPDVLIIRDHQGAPGVYALRWSPGLRASGAARTSPPHLSFDGDCQLRGALPRASLHCEPGPLIGTLRLEHLPHDGRVETFIRLRTSQGHGTFLVSSTSPELRLGAQGPEAPSQVASAFRYLRLGLSHIASGADHLLFVILVVLGSYVSPPTVVSKRGATPGQRRAIPSVLLTLTGFTLAHSLALAALALEWIDGVHPMVEAWIAASLVLTAAHLVHVVRGDEESQVDWRLVAVFGLVHGLGFGGALVEVGLPPSARWRSLLAFNIGIELGQFVVVLVTLALIAVVQRVASRYGTQVAGEVRWPTWGRLLPLYLIGTVACAWMIERAGAVLR